MQLIHRAQELDAGGRKVCLAIGFFDGVHLGHQEIIQKTISDASEQRGLSLILTFDRHPATIVAPERAPKLIYSLPQKMRTVASLGPDVLLLIHFDAGFSAQTGEQFIRSLARDLGGIHSIRVGENFAFGHNRSGNVALLRELGEDLGFSVRPVAPVSMDGSPLSSTRVREAIRNGDLALASRMLGRAYSLSGPVIHGDRLGQQLGFPTANLDVHELLLPQDGVYAGQALHQGKAHKAVMNIGVRPTLANARPERRVEAHLLDFDGDLYGQELEFVVERKLRDERKFGSIEELKHQISRDIQAACTPA